MKKQIFIIFFCYCFILASCEQRPQLRQYSEIVVETSGKENRMLDDDPHAFLRQQEMMPGPFDMKSSKFQDIVKSSVAQVELNWETPEDWKEQRGNGIRLVTFITESDSPIQCTIISFTGKVGGVKENIERWARQIGINDLTEKDMERFMKKSMKLSSKSGIAFEVFEFTLLQDYKDHSVPSMIAAMATLGDKTVFVKMTGSLSAVLVNRDKFLSLCRSLQE